AHGAGSLCGKSLSKETWSTLGEQKISNYALGAESKEQFIELVSSDQMEVPMYFPASASKNLQGATPLNRLTAPIEFSAADLSSFEGIVIDVRTVAEFGAGHLPGSINIGLGGQFASWAGTVVPIGTPVVIFAVSKNQVDEAVMRLARIGIETVEGYLLHETMKISLKEIPQVPVASVAEIVMGVEGIQLVDVRRPAEYANGHAAGAVNLPLDRLSRDLTGLDKSKPTYVICQSGYRSSLASGILERAGFESVQNVTGGTQAWIAGELPVETTASACQASRN
ncbi:MAG: rhodanese-like domain-containing protein, partial [Acidobacteriota bacterium]